MDTFVRHRAEVAAIAAYRSFLEADLENPAHTIHVGFLQEPLSAGQSRGLLACRTDADEFHVNGREFYWLCRIKSHESQAWNSPAMRALKLPTSSMRNITTVRKLAALYPAPGG